MANRTLLEAIGQGEELTEKVRQILSGETTICRELEVSQEEMEAFYGVAYSMYESGRHHDALKVFSLLASMNPSDFRFIFGAASCFQLIEEYMMAALFYQLAGSLDPQNPAPMLHTAECLMALKDKEGARYALEEVGKRSGDNLLYAPVRQRAEVMLANLGA